MRTKEELCEQPAILSRKRAVKIIIGCGEHKPHSVTLSLAEDGRTISGRDTMSGNDLSEQLPDRVGCFNHEEFFCHKKKAILAFCRTNVMIYHHKVKLRGLL